MYEAWPTKMDWIHEKWLHISCFWEKVFKKKKKKKSELIKTEVEELGFMDILPKVQALGHNSGSFWELLLKVSWTA